MEPLLVTLKALAFCDAAARDKRLAREICHEKGVPAPMFMKVTTPEEVKAATDKLGFPLIVKPSSGASSEGVYRCETLEDTQDKCVIVLLLVTARDSIGQ
jgi:biotin carboxylase